MESSDWITSLRRGMVIPAHPLALTAERKLDERRQRALTRYYLAAGAGGLAVGVHTTQFAIRECGLYQPVLALAAEEMRGRDVIGVAGICGSTPQAVREAGVARALGYRIGLLSLSALREATVDELIAHLAAVGEILPIFGFYLQPAVGGRVLSYDFWRRAVDLDCLKAIKIAPFNRYHTLDVIRAVHASGRPIALYTGNDDNIVADLITPFWGHRIVGGLLGQWAVWTKRAAEMLPTVGPAQLGIGVELTDANAALFDAANQFRGCIAGIHEILRRQGLLAGRWCLDEREDLSPGQMEEIDRVTRAYPHLQDDDFVKEHLDAWLR